MFPRKDFVEKTDLHLIYVGSVEHCSSNIIASAKRESSRFWKRDE